MSFTAARGDAALAIKMIVVGVDVHKHSLTAVAVDERGRPLQEYAGSVDDGVLAWTRTFDEERLRALEGIAATSRVARAGAGRGRRTVSKWLACYRAEGEDGLVVRSSAPQCFPTYENIAKVPIQESGGMADLITTDSRVGLAISLTWLPTVSHQAVHDVPRALTEAGLVRRIQPSGSAGRGTLEL